MEPFNDENDMVLLEEESDFTPRDYQIILYERAKEENTIIFLPTGSGKTFVAIMLIKDMTKQLEQPYRKGGKRCFFLVNTTALVVQQTENILKHTNFKVRGYTGDMGVDFWSKVVWMKEFKEVQVFVMTTQIFYNIVEKNLNITLEDVCLIIFDECHHAVDSHPMREVMRLFEFCPKYKQPRVLGLTATLLNRNCNIEKVQDEIRTLETTFHAKVATVGESYNVAQFSTNPQEKMLTFDGEVDYETPECRYVDGMIKFIRECRWPPFDNVEISTLRQSLGIPIYRDVKLLKTAQKLKNHLANCLNDVILHTNMMGIYGGHKAALAIMVHVERLLVKETDQNIRVILKAMHTTLRKVRKCFTDTMEHCPFPQRIMNYSSTQVKKLINHLESFHLQETLCVSEGEFPQQRKLCALIFVERRLTARVLYHILKDLKTYSLNHDFMDPDYAVGNEGSPIRETREAHLKGCWQREAILKFTKHETNILVASDVLEEGVDIPACNLVVKFNLPKQFRSYVQSKGRARSQTGNYVLMVGDEESQKFQMSYNKYITIEKTLKMMLAGKTDAREAPTPQQIEEELYATVLRPYFASSDETGPCVTAASAVSLVNRYCSLLPHDVFTNLAPLWWVEKCEGVKVKIHLQLPMNSPLCVAIEGDKMPNLKLAKRSVALKACVELHRAGELNDDLLPCRRPVQALNDLNLFKHYKEETTEKPEVGQPGTKKRKRYHVSIMPSSLYGCRPMPEKEAYIHALVLTPKFAQPPETEIRARLYHTILTDSKQCYGIISAKKMPVVGAFPIFLAMGEVQVKIGKPKLCTFSVTEIENLVSAQKVLFRDILRISPHGLVFDNTNKDRSLLVAPLDKDMARVNWEAVSLLKTNVTKVVPVKPKDRMQNENHLRNSDYVNTCVSPWYRAVADPYIVVRVRQEMNALSLFPSVDRKTFEGYYKEKYPELSIVLKDLPLIEVKQISESRDFRVPRLKTSTTSKKKRKENDTLEELLVPELCSQLTYPADLWFLATLLPTILYRLEHLAVASLLRDQIAAKTGAGMKEIPDDFSWPEMKVNLPTPKTDDSPSVQPMKKGVLVINGGKPKKSTIAWKIEDEPRDIYKHMEDVDVEEIREYELFMSTHLSGELAKLLAEEFVSKIVFPSELGNITDDLLDLRWSLGLDPSLLPGPSPALLLQALTTTSAADAFCMEQLETLGDSFLKLAASLYLFLQFPTMDEGRLTEAKGRLVGNRHLFYCGEAMKLSSAIVGRQFQPYHDWIPPGCSIPTKIKHLLLSQSQQPDILVNLKLSNKEKEAGNVSSRSLEDLVDLMLKDTKTTTLPDVSLYEGLISHHCVRDKCVADCVESVIGAYLQSLGPDGALRFMGWLDLLPYDVMSDFYNKEPPSPLLVHTPNVMDSVEVLLESTSKFEDAIGYHFKNRAYLLQALSHPSNYPNRFTDCYQRLEFLGDAVLDFIITKKIYTDNPNLTPGEMTDLRSALVNNYTFSCLAVRHGFHKFLLHQSSDLDNVISHFVNVQEANDHVVDHQHFLMEESEYPMAEEVDVPKALGDVFESIAGAIFLDSGMSLQAVWKVYYRIMRPEIISFSKNVPKNPLRRLYEKFNKTNVTFKDAVALKDKASVMVKLYVNFHGDEHKFYGFGKNKTNAKRAAAKRALKVL